MSPPSAFLCAVLAAALAISFCPAAVRAQDPVNRCLTLPTVDTTCAVYLARYAIPSLNFASPAWQQSFPNWRRYLIQDGLYMIMYPSVVVERMMNMCSNDPTIDQSILQQLNNSLSPPLDIDQYAKNYNIPGFENDPMSSELVEYRNLYMSTDNCYAHLSAMMPCLCIYPAIADALFVTVGSKPIDCKLFFFFFGSLTVAAGFCNFSNPACCVSASANMCVYVCKL